MGDHDAFLKRIFSNPAHAAGELASVLPRELVAVLDLGKLELIPGSFVDDAMAERACCGSRPRARPCASSSR